MVQGGLGPSALGLGTVMVAGLYRPMMGGGQLCPARALAGDTRLRSGPCSALTAVRATYWWLVVVMPWSRAQGGCARHDPCRRACRDTRHACSDSLSGGPVRHAPCRARVAPPRTMPDALRAEVRLSRPLQKTSQGIVPGSQCRVSLTQGVRLDVLRYLYFTLNKKYPWSHFCDPRSHFCDPILRGLSPDS